VPYTIQPPLFHDRPPRYPGHTGVCYRLKRLARELTQPGPCEPEAPHDQALYAGAYPAEAPHDQARYAGAHPAEGAPDADGPSPSVPDRLCQTYAVGILDQRFIFWFESGGGRAQLHTPW
jgi:hypothetical protein